MTNICKACGADAAYSMGVNADVEEFRCYSCKTEFSVFTPKKQREMQVLLDRARDNDRRRQIREARLEKQQREEAREFVPYTPLNVISAYSTDSFTPPSTEIIWPASRGLMRPQRQPASGLPGEEFDTFLKAAESLRRKHSAAAPKGEEKPVIHLLPPSHPRSRKKFTVLSKEARRKRIRRRVTARSKDIKKRSVMRFISNDYIINVVGLEVK